MYPCSCADLSGAEVAAVGETLPMMCGGCAAQYVVPMRGRFFGLCRRLGAHKSVHYGFGIRMKES